MSRVNNFLKPECFSFGDLAQMLAAKCYVCKAPLGLGKMGSRIIIVVLKLPAKLVDVPLNLILALGKIIAGAVVDPILFVVWCVGRITKSPKTKNIKTDFVWQGVQHVAMAFYHLGDGIFSLPLNIIKPTLDPISRLYLKSEELEAQKAIPVKEQPQPEVPKPLTVTPPTPPIRTTPPKLPPPPPPPPSKPLVTPVKRKDPGLSLTATSSGTPSSQMPANFTDALKAKLKARAEADWKKKEEKLEQTKKPLQSPNAENEVVSPTLANGTTSPSSPRKKALKRFRKRSKSLGVLDAATAAAMDFRLEQIRAANAYTPGTPAGQGHTPGGFTQSPVGRAVLQLFQTSGRKSARKLFKE